MTSTCTALATQTAAASAGHHLLNRARVWLAGRIARRFLPNRLARLSEAQLRDIGLHAGDIDWLRGQGTSQDAATRLGIRADLQSRNW